MKISISIYIFLMALSTYGQERIVGYVRDGQSQEVLIGASAINLQTGKGCSSNLEGYYSFIAHNTDSIRFSYVGYRDTVICISENTTSPLIVKLKKGYSLNEITINANANDRFDLVRMTPQELALIPSLGGKPDVLKTMQLLPGITTQNEGSSALIVRGGSPGQNLYLIDNVPLIYVNHLGGFTSVFNPDAINGIDMYKGNFPPKYGGKLSSIINIAQKEGNTQEQKGNISIGITDLSFALEGPIKEKTSYILTGRKTLIDPLMMLASSLSGGADYIASYGFHDINGKVTHRWNKNNTLHLNLYYGDDYLSFRSNNGNKSKYKDIWGNWLVAAHWKHLFPSGLTNTNTISFNNYRLKKMIINHRTDGALETTYRSSVKNTMLRSDWDYQILDWWKVNYGLQSQLWQHAPNSFDSNLGTSYTTIRSHSLENDLYIDNSITIGESLKVNIGNRLLNYSTANYETSKVEPRLQALLKISQYHTLSLGYTISHQSSHLIFTPGEINQNEIWLNSNNKHPLAQSKQYTVGWKSSLIENKINTEFNLYSKDFSHLVSFREGYSFMPGDASWQSKLIGGGTGKSRGLEFIIRKQKGRVNGFASYSYTETTRTFEQINGGEPYIYEYSRPHTATINLNYNISNKLTASATWVYQTGLPYTPVLGKQLTIDTKSNPSSYYEALIYGKRNSERMRNYHRLDLGLKYETTSKRGNKAEWSFSLYNAYMRQNPNYYYYNTNNYGDIIYAEKESPINALKLYQMSYFVFIPSVSYKVYFNKDSKIKRKAYRLAHPR